MEKKYPIIPLFTPPSVSSPAQGAKTLFITPSIAIEHIASGPQTTPPHKWLSDERDLFLLLLRGMSKLTFFDGTRRLLSGGECILIPAHTPYRVSFASSEPGCVWLCVYCRRCE